MPTPVDDVPVTEQLEEPQRPQQREKLKEVPTPEQRRKPTQKKKRLRRRRSLREEEARVREELMREKASTPRRRREFAPKKRAPIPKKPVRKPPARRRKPRPAPPEITRPRPRVPQQENKIVVYTALFGNDDRLWTPHPSFVHEATFVIFTEKPREEVGTWVDPKRPHIKHGTAKTSVPQPVWEQRIVKPGYDNRKSARYYKTLIPELFDEYEFSIWVDANVRLAVSPIEAVERWLGNSDIAAIKHLTRSCLYNEAKECIGVGKGSRAKIAAQTRFYRNEGMPERWGLPSTRCVIRRHNDVIAQLNESWWREIEKYSVRDQISLPYIAWKLGISWNIIPGIRSKAFWFIRHKELPK